jgi:hypothetical protein
MLAFRSQRRPPGTKLKEQTVSARPLSFLRSHEVERRVADAISTATPPALRAATRALTDYLAVEADDDEVRRVDELRRQLADAERGHR